MIEMVKHCCNASVLFLLKVLTISLVLLSGACKEPNNEHSVIKISAKHEHPQLHNPADIIVFRDKFVATELYTNRLAIFDDLNFTNLHHFDPQSIGKRFNSPHFLATTPWDTLLISNGWGDSIIEIADLDGKGWKEFKGIDKKFNAPHGICVDQNGWIYVGDSLNSRLVRFKDMDGRDWQVFPDHDKKISYIRELTCEKDGVWISNSYENRKGLNKGKGGNILKLMDFESGKVQTVHTIADSNITGFIKSEDRLLVNLFAKSSTRLLDSKRHTQLQEFIEREATGMGVPYGTFSLPDQNLFLSTYIGEFKDRSNLGGILSLKEGPYNAPDGITWTMINVNKTTRQGDAHLIEVRGGKTILIDTGFPQFTISEVIPFLKRKNIGVIDAVYISHAHLDHYGGLDDIAEAGIIIEEAWFNPLNEKMCSREARCYYDKYLQVQKKLALLGTKVGVLKTGDVHDLGNSAGLKVITAYSDTNMPVESNDVNDTSAIFSIDYSGYKFLFAGDLNMNMGGYLAGHATDLKADILKVPHHGAEGLAPNEFFAKVRPRFALVPAPSHLWLSKRSERVRQWFQDQKIPVFVNGISGNVQVTVSNGKLSIQEQYPAKETYRTLKMSIPEAPEHKHQGHVDTASCENSRVIIKGWAPWKDLNKDQALYVVSSHQLLDQQLKAQTRNDVFKVFNNPDLKYSGFELTYTLKQPCRDTDLSFCLIAEEPQSGDFFRLQNDFYPDACTNLLKE